MRISDWSSDVCSSDLALRSVDAHTAITSMQAINVEAPRSALMLPLVGSALTAIATGIWAAISRPDGWVLAVVGCVGVLAANRRRSRSEEHTSELQSLMRISYAVFCLKKKNKTTTQIKFMHTINNKRHNNRLKIQEGKERT